MRIAVVLSLSLTLIACSERPEEAPAATVPAPKAVPKPEPPKPPPVPTLAAVYSGDAATRLLAAGLAKPDASPAPSSEPPAPAPSSAENPALLASASPTVPAPAPAEPAAPTRALLSGPAISAEPHERPDDEVWTLPAVPEKLVWKHPAPAAGLQVELLEARGRSWPTRVRIEAAGDVRVATLVPLEPLPAGTDFRLVARVVAHDGQALLWTEPLRVKPAE